jgi:hypothetical protein
MREFEQALGTAPDFLCRFPSQTHDGEYGTRNRRFHFTMCQTGDERDGVFFVQGVAVE